MTSRVSHSTRAIMEAPLVLLRRWWEVATAAAATAHASASMGKHGTGSDDALGSGVSSGVPADLADRPCSISLMFIDWKSALIE